MATVTLTPDRIQKAFEDLEVQKTLITTCTLQWKSLADHFSSLDKTLDERSQTLDSKIQSLDSETKKTLESLDQRESSIPERESSAAAEIKEKKDSVVKELEDAEAKNPEDTQRLLRYYCRRMDSGSLWRFMISRRKDLSLLRRETAEAVGMSVDPCRLVLDDVEDFLNWQASNAASAGGQGSGGDRCWALGMLLRALFHSEGRKGPPTSEKIRERAEEVAEAWRAKAGGEGGEMGGAEVQIFLQLVVAFSLSSRFEEELLRKLVMEHATRKEMAKLAAGLGFGEKVAGIIDELIKSGKELEAVYFAQEAGLSERFPPAPLLKSYLQSSKKSATAILKNGKHSASSTEESRNMELNAMRSVIRFVEYYKLETEYRVDGLKKQLAQMEKTKAERKKAAQAKRARPSSGGAYRPPSKSIRTAVSHYPSYHHNPPPAVRQMLPPPGSSSYNYPTTLGGSSSSSGYDAPPASSYGAPHYMKEDMGGPKSGVPYGGGSSVMSYGGYDYSASQPQYPH